MGRRLVLGLSFALAATSIASADDLPPPFAPSIVEIRLNDQPEGPTLIVRRDVDGKLLIKTEDLPQLRLQTPSRSLVTVDGEHYLRLDAEIGATVAFDDATQSARVTLPPDAFLPMHSSALSPDAPQVTTADLGGFVNYDLFGEQVDDRTSLGSILDIGVFGSRGVVTNSLIGRHDDDRREVLRLDSTWTLDNKQNEATSSSDWHRLRVKGTTEAGDFEVEIRPEGP